MGSDLLSTEHSGQENMDFQKLAESLARIEGKIDNTNKNLNDLELKVDSANMNIQDLRSEVSNIQASLKTTSETADEALNLAKDAKLSISKNEVDMNAMKLELA